MNTREELHLLPELVLEIALSASAMRTHTAG
jgi:hypothetical protein